MNNLTYHESSPENNNQSGFTEFSSVGFVLDAPGRKLLKNSIRLEPTNPAPPVTTIIFFILFDLRNFYMFLKLPDLNLFWTSIHIYLLILCLKLF